MAASPCLVGYYLDHFLIYLVESLYSALEVYNRYFITIHYSYVIFILGRASCTLSSLMICPLSSHCALPLAFCGMACAAGCA